MDVKFEELSEFAAAFARAIDTDADELINNQLVNAREKWMSYDSTTQEEEGEVAWSIQIHDLTIEVAFESCDSETEFWTLYCTLPGVGMRVFGSFQSTESGLWLDWTIETKSSRRTDV